MLMDTASIFISAAMEGRATFTDEPIKGVRKEFRVAVRRIIFLTDCLPFIS